MDFNDVFSPASRSHQSSFGILDEKAMQDLSLENLQRKPPIPVKQQVSGQKRAASSNNNQQDDMDLDGENPEQTVESIRFNESDLKELEDEFTFDEEDESDEHDSKENGQKHESKQTKSKNFELTSVSPDHFLDFDKSSNISSDAFKRPDGQTTQLSNDFLVI